MKPRRVLVTLEVETRLSLHDLRDAAEWNYWLSASPKVIQAQANVIKAEKPKGKGKK